MRMTLQQTNAALLRAIRAAIAGTGADAAGEVCDSAPALIVETVATEPWASLTFRGERHRLQFRIEGPQPLVLQARGRLAADLEALSAGEGGQFLADAELNEHGYARHADGRISMTLELLALTIEE